MEQIEPHHQWKLVGVIVEIDKSIVQQESCVTFLAVRVVHLLSSFDVICCFDDEPLSFITVGPLGFLGSLVIKHVCIGYKAVSLDTVYWDSEDAAANHHTHFAVLLQRKLFELWHLGANHSVIRMNVLYFVSDNILHGTSFKPLSFFNSVKYREVCKVFRQNIDEVFKVRGWLAPFLHDEAGEEGVLWWK